MHFDNSEIFHVSADAARVLETSRVSGVSVQAALARNNRHVRVIENAADTASGTMRRRTTTRAVPQP